MIEHLMFIDGKDVPAESGAFLTISNPATARPIATVPNGVRVDVDKAAAAARVAFESGPWPRMGRTARAKVLLKAADALEAASESLFTLETQNNGRPITETRAQLSRVPEWFRYNAGLLAAQRDAVLPSDGPYLTYQHRTPLGVCGIITPFNHPTADPGPQPVRRPGHRQHRRGQAVGAHPAHHPRAGSTSCHAAGLPEGVVNVVTGGREAGERPHPASRRRQDHPDRRHRGRPRRGARHRRRDSPG